MKIHLAAVVACLFCSGSIQLCDSTFLSCEREDSGYEFLVRVVRHFYKTRGKKENLTLRNLNIVFSSM